MLLAVIAVCGCGRVAFEPIVDAEIAEGASGTTDSSTGVTLVQSTNGWSASRVTSRSVTLGAAPTAGNLVIVAVSTSFTAPVTVTDNAGNTYQGVSSNPTANSPTYCNILIYYARNVMTVDGFTATVMTSPGDDYLSVVVAELVSNAGMSATPMVGPIQSVRDGAFYFTLLCHNATRTTTMGSSYQVLEVPTEAGGTNSAMVTAFKLGDAVPTTADAMLSGSDYWQMMLAAFER
jgi:hypothetical protein